MTAHLEPDSSARHTVVPLSASSLPALKIKICGICNIEDAQLAVKYGANYIGLIFVKSSPRHIEPMLAKPIAETIRDKVHVVGVFQNSTLQEMENIASLVGLDYFQLHGQESPSLCSAMSKPVIKAFQLASKIVGQEIPDEACITLPLLDLQSGTKLVNAQASLMPQVYSAKDKLGAQACFSGQALSRAAAIENCLNILATYKPYCQHFLFDRPKKNSNYNWLESASQALNLIEEHVPDYFLAGGLNTNNIIRVLQMFKPAVLDIASGVENTPRQKSETLLADFWAKIQKQNDERLISQIEPQIEDN